MRCLVCDYVGTLRDERLKGFLNYVLNYKCIELKNFEPAKLQTTALRAKVHYDNRVNGSALAMNENISR